VSEEQESSDLTSNLAWFVAGAVVGMTAAILIAPQSGKDTRRLISDKTHQSADAVTGTGKDVFERSKEMVEKGRQLVVDALDLVERGRKLVRG